MALDKPYKNVPGTIIFDAEQARKGYQINQLCMSFMKPENRERYLADREAYLDEWQLTPKARQAILDLDLNAAMEDDSASFPDTCELCPHISIPFGRARMPTEAEESK